MSTVGGFKRRTAKNATTRRAVKRYEPKVVENPKRVLFLKGASSNDVVTEAMVDLMAIAKPYCKKLAKKNAFFPFEGRQHLEFLGFKNDCSLFCFGSSNKKRPNNLTIGRQFDFHVLDMVELGIVAADRLDMSQTVGVDAGSMGGKPFFVFDGSEFASDPTFMRLKNLLVDYFRGGNDVEINLDGCDRVLFFSLRSKNGEDACVAPSADCYTNKPPSQKGNAVLCMRHYAVKKPSAATGVPKSIKNIQLYDVGPNFDFEIRRISFATPQEFKVACRIPRQTLATLRSTADNVQSDGLNNLRGQLHVGKQDVQELNLRRFKAHRRGISSGAADCDEAAKEASKPRRRRARLETDAGESRPETDI
ncbi:brix domain containing-like protein [Leishmania infantum JPCM5]|uniref:Ribosome production factor 2 homolog n=2 Tax=Leishmania infantum TaxID=5671 RepID=A0A6L0XFN4_LEIIN|nr:brix domain containing-like protein [Leishmania infantum JPCM5]CAC9495595.1 brix_domain_containing-like_protein [Leishmania infantum]CAM68721.1 brix domain containing-like protein [Leishmania infantum JPCM5]SUZ42591.1 brix_domain_containing-like_protein [Leishmania infantum]|eukprot:XP_001470351.1 brix domain containing-like protein [Leishmania infantum JPCM5]